MLEYAVNSPVHWQKNNSNALYGLGIHWGTNTCDERPLELFAVLSQQRLFER